MILSTRPIRQLKHTQKLASNGFSVFLRLDMVYINEKTIVFSSNSVLRVSRHRNSLCCLRSQLFLCQRIGRVNQILQLSPWLGTVRRKNDSRSLSVSLLSFSFTLYTSFFFLRISINDLTLIIYGIGRGLQLGDSVDFSTYLHQRVSYQWLVFPLFCQLVHQATG